MESTSHVFATPNINLKDSLPRRLLSSFLQSNLSTPGITSDLVCSWRFLSSDRPDSGNEEDRTPLSVFRNAVEKKRRIIVKYSASPSQYKSVSACTHTYGRPKPTLLNVRWASSFKNFFRNGELLEGLEGIISSDWVVNIINFPYLWYVFQWQPISK